MPRILIISATTFEIKPLLDELGVTIKEEGLVQQSINSEISVLVTGVGMVNTAYQMGKLPSRYYTHVINVGICGSFNKKLAIGEVVNITEDTLSEMGAENDLEFIAYPDLNLGGTNTFHSSCAEEIALLNKVKKVKGITVNTVHGNEESIIKALKRYHPDVESMEGAAFLRACEGLSNNCLQLRGISNYVEKRDKSKWDLPLAIKNLNDLLLELITFLNQKS